jgi:hypothetical protein
MLHALPDRLCDPSLPVCPGKKTLGEKNSDTKNTQPKNKILLQEARLTRGKKGREKDESWGEGGKDAKEVEK